MSLFFQNTKNAQNSTPWLDKNIKNVNYLPDIAPWLKLVCVLNGEIRSTVDGRSLSAKSGDIIIIAPMEIHSFTSKKSEVTVINIPCSFKGEDTDLSLYTSGDVIKGGSALNTEIRDYVSILERELSDRVTGYTYMASGIARVLLTSLIRSGAVKELTPDGQKKREAEAGLIKDVKKYIEDNYRENVSLESASAYCNLSLFYFSHLFKRVTDITFYDYLTAYRLDKAIEMLTTENKRILEVAAECGFATVRTFNRCFKGFLNCTPSEYLSNK